MEIVEKSKAGMTLTPEEQERYNWYRQRRRGYNKQQYEKRKAAVLPMRRGNDVDNLYNDGTRAA